MICANRLIVVCVCQGPGYWKNEVARAGPGRQLEQPRWRKQSIELLTTEVLVDCIDIAYEQKPVAPFILERPVCAESSNSK